MSNEVPVNFIYLTISDAGRPILNVEAAHSEHFWRFELTHQQLLDLNNRTADTLLRASPERLVSPERSAGGSEGGSEGGKGKA